METVTSKEVGKALEALRRRRELSRKDVAKELGISEFVIGCIERGNINTQLNNYLTYCNFLNINIIFDFDEEEYDRGIDRLRVSKCPRKSNPYRV